MVPRHPVRDLLQGSLKGLRNEPKAKLLDYLGWHRQKAGMWFVGLPLLCGRLNGDLKAGLRQLVETYQLEIRLTANQDLLLCNIGTSQRASIRTQLEALGFEVPEAPAPLARHAIACPALPPAGSPSPNRSASFRMFWIGSIPSCGALRSRSRFWFA